MNTKPITSKRKLAAYNEAVKKAHQAILQDALTFISTIKRHELRCILQCEDNRPIALGNLVNRLISPLLYLSLEYNLSSQLCIHFGFELIEAKNYEYVVPKFLRSLYRHTALNNTSFDIESSIITNYVLTDCSALYEEHEDDGKYKPSVVPYKTERKKQQSLYADDY